MPCQNKYMILLSFFHKNYCLFFKYIAVDTIGNLQIKLAVW